MSITSLMQSVPNTKPSVGNNISLRNPDVEVMALTLNAAPGTMEGYQSLDNGKGWCNMKYMILNVGPPGFSSVPYTSNKKKGEKENGKRLYELAEDGSTRFFSYLPGKTNKDRGERVSVFAAGDDGLSVDVTATLSPGMCMSHFTRSDNYETGKEFVIGDELPDIIPEYSVVFMQLSSSNCEQAAKGRLLKVRKIKFGCNWINWQHCIRCLPSTPAQFREVNSTENRLSIRENIDTRNQATFFQFMASKTAFTTKEDDLTLICEASKDVDVAIIEQSTFRHILPNANEPDRIKFLNMALATGAVHLLLRSTQSDDNFALNAGDKYPNKVVGLHVDFNLLFGLDILSAVDLDTLSDEMKKNNLPISLPLVKDDSKSTTVEMHWQDQDLLVWSKGDSWGPTLTSPNTVTFSVGTTLNTSVDSDLPHTTNVFDRHAAGGFHEVRIHISQDKLTDFAAKLSTNRSERSIITLELRPENRENMNSKKRKRPVMEFE